MLDSDVRRGRPPPRPWMPNPAVTESCSSGRISPKRSPFDVVGITGNPVVGDSGGSSDLDAGPFVAAPPLLAMLFRGWLIRFAKDWELRFVIRSSVESLGRGRGILLDRAPYIWDDGLELGSPRDRRMDVAIEDVLFVVAIPEDVVVVVVGLVVVVLLLLLVLDRAE